ncbi:MAG: hypothetical protein NTZ34_06835, partial [Chloroflexi bacterium]|nr:hypothetical protein [Chloroflexota bacterium]
MVGDDVVKGFKTEVINLLQEHNNDGITREQLIRPSSLPFPYNILASNLSDANMDSILSAIEDYHDQGQHIASVKNYPDDFDNGLDIRWADSQDNIVGTDHFPVTEDFRDWVTNPPSNVIVFTVPSNFDHEWYPELAYEFYAKYGRNPEYPEDQSKITDLVKSIEKHHMSKYSQRILVARDPNSLSVTPLGYVKPGETLTYTVNYENEGEGNAYGVYITDVLRKGLDALTLKINDKGVYDPKTRTIKWTIGEVQSKQKGSVSFSINADTRVPDNTQILNFATVYFPSVPEETRTNGTVNIVSRHPQHIVVHPTTRLMTTEGGGTDNFTMVLTYKPTADVTINLKSDNPVQGKISPAKVTFTSMNWDTAQTVLITGVNDGVNNKGKNVYHIVTSPAISSDPGYNGIDPDDVTVVNVHKVHPDTKLPPQDGTKGNVNKPGIDTKLPTTKVQITPAPNENGWNNSDINVKLTVEGQNGETGVKSIHYKLTGAMVGEKTVQANNISITISTEGTTTLTYYAMDNATNREQEKSVVLKLDKTAPTVTIAASPDKIQATGHKMVSVVVNGTATDNLSDVVSTVLNVKDEYNLVEPKITAFGNTINLDAWCDDKDKTGRIYTISAIVKDKAGNEAESKATVTCPNGKVK